MIQVLVFKTIGMEHREEIVQCLDEPSPRRRADPGASDGLDQPFLGESLPEDGQIVRGFGRRLSGRDCREDMANQELHSVETLP